jgi:hypothetical protein
MEKVKQPFRKEYPILRLYKSDLEEIFNLFKDNYQKIEIVADGFKLDDISELNKIKKQEIVDCKIFAPDPYLYVEFLRISAIIYLSDEDDLTQRGLADKIGEILSRRKSPLRFLVTLWAEIPFLLIYFVLLFLIKDIKVAGITLLGFILFISLWGIWGYRVNTKKHSVIYLYDPSASGFFKRNKDNILISVISALMGGFITLLIAWLLKKI